MDRTHIVLLIHGIRTQGSWAEMVSAILERDPTVRVQPIKYGFFDTFRFLIPFWTREAPIRRIIREYRDAKRKSPNAKVSVIAHSFGTYAIFKSLREPDIEFFRVIFCGSIVPESFRVAQYRAQIAFDPILNDCGTHDVWPPLARSVTWGYGATGTFGFGTVGVRDRFNKFSHSQYFSKDFVETYWLPFIAEGRVVSTDWEVDRSAPPYWQSLLSIIPLKWLLPALPLFLGFLAWQVYERQNIPKISLAEPTTVGHLIGAAVMGVGLEFSNNGRQQAEFSDFKVELSGPDQKAIELDYYGISVGENMQPPLRVFIIQPGQKQTFMLAFRGDFWRQQALMFRAENEYPSPLPFLWTPSGRIFSDELTSDLKELALSTFPWEEGEWSISVRYVVSGSQEAVSSSFRVSGADVGTMKASIPYYETGLGILPFLQFYGPDGWRTTRNVSFQEDDT